MHADYTDILRRIKQSPAWWDMNGVPRYDTFRPDDSPNIYAEEVALLEVGCQSCGARFLVEVNGPLWRGRGVLATMVTENEITYGDPPRHDCTGDTMMSVPCKVKEFWRRGRAIDDWERLKVLERAIRQPEAIVD